MFLGFIYFLICNNRKSTHFRINGNKNKQKEQKKKKRKKANLKIIWPYFPSFVFFFFYYRLFLYLFISPFLSNHSFWFVFSFTTLLVSFSFIRQMRSSFPFFIRCLRRTFLLYLLSSSFILSVNSSCLVQHFHFTRRHKRERNTSSSCIFHLYAYTDSFLFFCFCVCFFFVSF